MRIYFVFFNNITNSIESTIYTPSASFAVSVKQIKANSKKEAIKIYKGLTVFEVNDEE